MRFSLNFVKEFVKVSVPAKVLADKLTMAGMEVESFCNVRGDWIFDVEITSNRYDWLSVVGIAREVSAVCAAELDIPLPKPGVFGKLSRDIVIEDKKDCLYYFGHSLSGASVKPSPELIKKRLLACGLNPINNIVDITNYCMLKWGNPLHAFDQDKIKGNIYVRRACNGEPFTGIDGKERLLCRDNLVIADEEKVIALAGVMGAKNTQISQDTRNIFLEAAIFSPACVRRSRRAAGVETDSSYRFERRVAARNLEFACVEAANMIIELGKVFSCGVKSAGSRPKDNENKIVIKKEELECYLGVRVDASSIKSLLGRLGCRVKALSGRGFLVCPPQGRFDLNEPVDIYEEFIRLYGYEVIPATLPRLSGALENRGVCKKGLSYKLKNELRNYMALLGFKEIITSSLEFSENENSDKDVIFIRNPMRSQENSLRTSLLPGMARCMQHNLNRGRDRLLFFEVADLYIKKGNSFEEHPVIAAGICAGDSDFFHLKAAAEKLLNFAGINTFEYNKQSGSLYSQGMNIISDGIILGSIGKVSADILDSLGFKKSIFYACFYLDKLAKMRKIKNYEPFSLYPDTFRDISLQVENKVIFDILRENIYKKGDFISAIEIVDFYNGPDIPSGSRAFTLRVFYQSFEKTLTCEEVDGAHNRIRQSLHAIPGVTVR